MKNQNWAVTASNMFRAADSTGSDEGYNLVEDARITCLKAGREDPVGQPPMLIAAFSELVTAFRLGQAATRQLLKPDLIAVLLKSGLPFRNINGYLIQAEWNGAQGFVWFTNPRGLDGGFNWNGSVSQLTAFLNEIEMGLYGPTTTFH